jgi:hypothetical protein
MRQIGVYQFVSSAFSEYHKKSFHDDEKSFRHHEKTFCDDEKTLRHHEKTFCDDVKSFRDDVKSFCDDEKSFCYKKIIFYLNSMQNHTFMG